MPDVAEFTKRIQPKSRKKPPIKGRTPQTQKFYRGELGKPRDTESEVNTARKQIGDVFNNMGGMIPNTTPPQMIPPGSEASTGGGLSASTLIQMLAGKGFTGQDLPLMAATIMRESGGKPGARNTAGENSFGLGQINVAPGANSQYAGRDLTDPDVNLSVMKEMFDRSGYTPWYGYSQNLPPRIEALKNYLPEMIRTATNMGLYQHQGPISFNPGGRYGAIVLDV